MKTIDYFYWINSDWAYLGADRLKAIAALHGAKINYRPIKLTHVYSRTGGVILPLRSPERQAYRVLELKRWCKRLGIHVNPYPRYMCPDDEAASCLVIAAMRAGHSAHEISQAIFRAQWVEERDISDPATLVQIADACGLDGKKLIAAARDSDVQAEFVRNTDDAVARGVFGSPAYFVDGEHFWGQDRLEWVERALTETS